MKIEFWDWESDDEEPFAYLMLALLILLFATGL